MCPHQVDKIGYPVDPELRRLQIQLCDLAGRWRFYGGDARRQEETVREYHATMAQLYALGWDAVLDVECELLNELMPEEYRRRHPLPPHDGWRHVSYEKKEDE
jgi:hypothetical protein